MVRKEESNLRHIGEDFICEWCGKDVMMKPHLEEDMDYITLHGPGEDQMLQLCRSCYITAYHGLMFAKEVVQDCPTNGGTHGRRIYVAVEQVKAQENELLNVLVWPTHSLAEHVKNAKRPSITYRVTPDS